MRHYHRIACIVLTLLAMTANSAWAQTATSADANRNWVMRTVFGTSRIHPWDAWAEWVDIRVGRISGPISVDFGIAGTGSRGPFITFTACSEIQPWHTKRISPFLRGEIGTAGESDYGGFIAGVGAGTVVRLAPRFGFRTGVAFNAHGGERGPLTAYSGLEF